jgi:hypothetical protein
VSHSSARRHGAGRHLTSALRPAAANAIRASISQGIQTYRRETDLPRLIPIDPARLANLDQETHRAILARLARALRGERNRGRAGHWTYDLNRHIALRQAYEAERLRLRQSIAEREKGRPMAGGPF